MFCMSVHVLPARNHTHTHTHSELKLQTGTTATVSAGGHFRSFDLQVPTGTKGKVTVGVSERPSVSGGTSAEAAAVQSSLHLRALSRPRPLPPR